MIRLFYLFSLLHLNLSLLFGFYLLFYDFVLL